MSKFILGIMLVLWGIIIGMVLESWKYNHSLKNLQEKLPPAIVSALEKNATMYGFYAERPLTDTELKELNEKMSEMSRR